MVKITQANDEAFRATDETRRHQLSAFTRSTMPAGTVGLIIINGYKNTFAMLDAKTAIALAEWLLLTAAEA